jgi:hypothetical protein
MKRIIAKGEEVPFTVSEDGARRKIFLSGKEGPFALVSWMEPGIREAHYHPTDQFQVVLEGEADFPENKLKPLDVHYVDSRTPYGPFNIPREGTVHAVLRRNKVGIVFTKAPPSYGKMSDPKGRQLFALQAQMEWQEYARGVRGKITLGGDGKSPSIEIMRGKKDAEMMLPPAPDGEFVIFHTGKFAVDGEAVEGKYSILYFEGRENAPRITFENDDATLLVARYDRTAKAH